MKNKRSPLWLISFLLLTVSLCHATDEHKTLPIGADAPDFKLPGVDGKTYSLSSFKNAKVLVIIFTCNHCPTAQAYEERLVKLTSDYKDKGRGGITGLAADNGKFKIPSLRNLGFTAPYMHDGRFKTLSMVLNNYIMG